MQTKFKIGQLVYYTPNIENIKPISQRPQDIGEIVALDETYVSIQFAKSDTIHKILYSAIKSYDLEEDIDILEYNQEPINVKIDIN